MQCSTQLNTNQQSNITNHINNIESLINPGSLVAVTSMLNSYSSENKNNNDDEDNQNVSDGNIANIHESFSDVDNINTPTDENNVNIINNQSKHNNNFDVDINANTKN